MVLKTPADSPRVAMLAALGRVQDARGLMIRGRYREVVGRLRDAESALRRALERYHNERQQELDLDGTRD